MARTRVWNRVRPLPLHKPSAECPDGNPVGVDCPVQRTSSAPAGEVALPVRFRLARWALKLEPMHPMIDVNLDEDMCSHNVGRLRNQCIANT
jgi:hypothetical protein